MGLENLGKPNSIWELFTQKLISKHLSFDFLFISVYENLQKDTCIILRLKMTKRSQLNLLALESTDGYYGVLEKLTLYLWPRYKFAWLFSFPID